MKRFHIRRALAVATASLALFCGSTLAAFDPVNDDTDIFLANPNFAATRPNVLIFLDNTANWSQAASGTTKYAAVRTALNAVMNGVVTDNFNVGLGMFVETGNPNNNEDGGYIRFGVRQMTAANKTAFTTLVTGLGENADKGNNATFSLAMDEMHRYFGGISTHAGHGKNKADAGGYIYSGSSRVALSGSPLPLSVLPTDATPTPVGAGTASNYTSPITDACQKNFIVFVSNGEAGDNASSLSTAQTHLTSALGGVAPTTIPLDPDGEHDLWADEYAKFMASADCNLNVAGTQNVYTYAIDVLPKSSGQGPAHTALLKSMAAQGKGKYFAITDISNTTQIEAAFTQIFQEVQSVNSVFASTTLPVSVNVRGTNLNQVYVGVFRPDSKKRPRWFGNLKLYKFSLNSATGSIFLSDANGLAAENSATGFVSNSAKSFWTATSTFWSYRTTDENGVGGGSDSPDGDLVEKGGAAQRLRAVYATDPSTRKVYTCIGAAANGLCANTALLSATLFNTTNVTPADLGVYTTYPVSSIAYDSVTAKATLTLSSAPSPAWSTGNTVRIAGGEPTLYNGDYSVTKLTDTTYTYTPASVPSATTAQATTAPNHGLISGDLVIIDAVDDTFDAASPGVQVTKVSDSKFNYTFAAGGGSTTTVNSAKGRKLVTNLSGTGTTATASIVGHGYALVGNTATGVTITGANESAFNVTNATVTVTSTDSFTYTTGSTITGTSNASRVTLANPMTWATGSAIGIRSSTDASYNTGTYAATTTGSTSFTIPYTSGPAATGGVAGVVVTSIAYPNTGTTQNVATATTATNHGFTSVAPATTVNFGGSRGTYVASSKCAGHDGTAFTVTSTPTPTTFTFTGDKQCGGETTSTMVVGFVVNTINPEVTATGTIYSEKAITISAISALAAASGTMTAGRPTDGDTTGRDNLVAWMHGSDNIADDTDDTDLSNVRAGIHGDVLHSRPAVINYNRFGNDDDVYAFYGGNDGVFRAVKGGFSSSESGVSPGDERWAFVAKEHFSKLNRLREQSPTISNANQKGYFWDGSTGVYTKDGSSPVDGKFSDPSVDKVYLYPAMRRGVDSSGNGFLYALDVTTPDAPKLLWRKGSTDTGWGQLGQMWSEPKVAKSPISIGNTSNPDNIVLVFGAGYDDAVEDINPCLLNKFNTGSVEQKAIGAGTITYTAAGSCTIAGATGSATTISRTKGRGIMVVDAFNGNVFWQAGAAPTGATNNIAVPNMTCAVPSDVTVFDQDRNGTMDRAYFGDTCGNVWRVDFRNTSVPYWRVTRLASLSGTDPAVITDKIKFLFPPDLVRSKDGDGNFTAVLLGAGDREHPFDTTVQNAFFMIKDRDSSTPVTLGAPNSSTIRTNGTYPDASGSAPFTKSSLFNATNADGSNDAGWYINFLAGEKNVGGTVTLGGTTFFATNQPSATAGGGSCGSNLGIARIYLVNFETGAATTDLNSLGTLSTANRSTIVSGGGYLPTPVPAVVDPTGGGTPYQIVCYGIHCVPPTGTTLNTRVRTYWYKEVE